MEWVCLNLSLAFMLVLVPNGPAQPGTADFGVGDGQISPSTSGNC